MHTKISPITSREHTFKTRMARPYPATLPEKLRMIAMFDTTLNHKTLKHRKPYATIKEALTCQFLEVRYPTIRDARYVTVPLIGLLHLLSVETGIALRLLHSLQVHGPCLQDGNPSTAGQNPGEPR